MAETSVNYVKFLSVSRISFKCRLCQNVHSQNHEIFLYPPSDITILCVIWAITLSLAKNMGKVLEFLSTQKGCTKPKRIENSR